MLVPRPRTDPDPSGPDDPPGEPTVPHAETVGLDDLSLVQRFPGPIAYWDSDLRHVVSSGAYQEHYGVDGATIADARLPDVLGEETFARARHGIERALAGHQSKVRLPSTDAARGTRWTEETYEPDVLKGTVRGLYVSLVDVTDDVQAQRLAGQAQRLADLGTWTMDPRTREITWSEEMYRLLGHDPETFTPSFDSLVPHIHPEDAERVLTSTRAAMESGVGYELDYRIVRVDGEVREIHSRVHGERDSDGTLVMLYGVMQDLTARHALVRELGRLNGQLQALNELHEDVLGVLGHDVKQPLTVVLGQLETVIDLWDSSPAEDHQHRVRRALAAARRLLGLCNNILALARSVSGAIDARPASVELPEVVSEALEDLDRGGDVEVDVDPSAPPALVDPVHLRQMVANLVSNAFRYGAAPVTVTVAAGEDSVVLEVADRGPGVPPDFVPHLFDRFSRAENDGPASHPGSGFGLYVVHRLAEANGASVEHEHREPNGALFRLVLPRAAG